MGSQEASLRGLAVNFAVADMRSCAEVHRPGFDVVLSADNAVPHLLGDDAILVALRSFFQCLRPDGVAVVSLREYLPHEDRSSPQLWPYGFRSDGEHRYFVVQTRDWDGDFYGVAMYFVREARGDRPAKVIAGSSRYYAVSIDRLVSLFGEAGFRDTRRLDGVLRQPVVVARRPAG